MDGRTCTVETGLHSLPWFYPNPYPPRPSGATWVLVDPSAGRVATRPSEWVSDYKTTLQGFRDSLPVYPSKRGYAGGLRVEEVGTPGWRVTFSLGLGVRLPQR